MSITFWFRASALTLALWAVTALSARAQDEFRIVNVHQTTSNDLIKVGTGWRKDLPRRMQVSLQVLADTPSSSIYVKAYFYDHDAKLVGTYNSPNSIWTSTGHGIDEVKFPAVLPHGKITDVYFALPEDLQAKKWTTILVVFGNDTKAAAFALPGSELPKLDYPEKSKVPAPK